ncbi:MAG: aminoacetone oxidase family FAD-binding enzyme [Lachnospiraceae bacterium]|nr:aminoacetone oxidase family FAD-binding enzyme [Lachnospiraceae bacterium]
MKNRVVIAGGGASGLTAAIFAAENGADVTVLEHRDRVGKKILMTGNGKCNLTNMSDVHGNYYSSDSYSLNKIYDTLGRFDAMKTRDFFKRIGLYTKEKRDGGVYPVSEQASIVLDVLRGECDRLGVNIRTDCDITSIDPDEMSGCVHITQYIREEKEQGKNGGKNKKNVVVSEKKETVHYDRLILATGGRAAPASGSDGSGYRLARKLGHSIIEPLPALVQLRCYGDFFKEVSGVRAQSRLVLYIDGNPAAGQEGELQLTDYGISGIPVFQFSRLASRALYEGRTCEVGINFIPYIARAADVDTAHFYYKPVQEFLSGLVHKKVAALICKKKGIPVGVTVGQTGSDKVHECLDLLADFRVKAAEPNSFENAQVCCGGVPLAETGDNFESRKCKNVYLVGELLDCDGICGGYNLQWAWATGAIAGAAAAGGSIEKEVWK